MLYKDKPENFSPRFEVVSCFVEYKNEILLLLRQDHKPEGNTYGVPAGKVDVGETIHEAMQREGREETQIDFNDAEYFDKLYVRYPDYDFIYHMYSKKFTTKPNVTIDPKEHKSFTRKTPQEALKSVLIRDLDECIKLFY
jgi:8-oxo-dGTP pyrophosphatase MutT (NUDIX family)